MKAHSEKLMDESDMQVPDEDNRHEDPSRSKTIKANNKIVKERKTLDSRFVSKQLDRGRMKFDQSSRQQDYETASGIRH